MKTPTHSKFWKARPPASRRRRLSMAAVAGIAALLLGACGDGGGGEPSAGDTATEQATADNATGGETEPGGADEGLVLSGEEIADADTYAAAQEEGTLTLYTAWGEANETRYAEAFENDTGIGVEVVRLPPGQLYERILSERQADIHTADVFRGGDMTSFDALSDEGVLESYDVLNSGDLSSDYIFEDGEYYVWMQSAYTLGYNSEVVSEEDAPTSWFDILDEKWTDNLAIVDPVPGAWSTTAVYEFLRELSPDFWERLAAQNPQILGGSAHVTEALARGEVAVAFVLPGTVSAAIADGAPIEWIIPEEGLVVYENWVGKVADAPNPNAAEVFLNYVFSRHGQTMASEELGVYSVLDDVPAPMIAGEPFPSRDEVTLYEQDLQAVLENYDTYIDEWYETFDYQP